MRNGIVMWKANNQELNSEGVIEWQKQTQLDQMKLICWLTHPDYDVDTFDLTYSKVPQEENSPNPRMVIIVNGEYYPVLLIIVTVTRFELKRESTPPIFSSLSNLGLLMVDKEESFCSDR